MRAAERITERDPDGAGSLHVLLALRPGWRRDVAADVLRTVGYAVTVADDVVEGLRRLERTAVAVVVVEASLPGRGLKLIRAARWARVPTRFLLAGEDDGVDAPTRFHLGHTFPYLPAPWNPLDLAHRVTRVARDPGAPPPAPS